MREGTLPNRIELPRETPRSLSPLSRYTLITERLAGTKRAKRAASEVREATQGLARFFRTAREDRLTVRKTLQNPHLESLKVSARNTQLSRKISASKGSKIPHGRELSPLELAILRGLSRGKAVFEVARLANVAPAKVGNEIATLQLRGYLSSDGRLTDKGLAVLED